MVQRKFDSRHEIFGSFKMDITSVSAADISTIIPIVMNDDAQGDPMDYMANPEHASWSENAKVNCFPDSEIRNLHVTLDIIGQDGLANIVQGIVVDYALIQNAFPEKMDAIDEKSGLSVKEILELQKETTDRQCYPLWNGTDMQNANTMDAAIPGFTASQTMEGITFSKEVFKDHLRYSKLKELLRTFLPVGFRTKYCKASFDNGFHKRIKFDFVPSGAKFINPYTFLGLLVSLPQEAASTAVHDSSNHQPFVSGTVSSGTLGVLFLYHITFDQRNPEFHMAKV